MKGKEALYSYVRLGTIERKHTATCNYEQVSLEHLEKQAPRDHYVITGYLSNINNWRDASLIE